MIDLGPLARLALMGAVLALGPLAWFWVRHRGANATARQRALTLLTLFLTFDLVLFGAFTRLTDSGLGCPDWPGCYGSASPLGARQQIDVAQSALPSGPVTHGKAWIEMIHRYLASAVGVLILVLAALSWLAARRGQARVSPWWAGITLLWVCVQGAFGALTVTMKLFPAIVTLHLLGGLILLALLTCQSQLLAPMPLPLPGRLKQGAMAVALLATVQITLGGWVSTNYAVLACTDFPRCQGSWWPPMNFSEGFTVWRELGAGSSGGFIQFSALTAIHYAHRLMAYALMASMLALAWGLHRDGSAVPRRFAIGLASLVAWQLFSGLSNVLLDWPLWGAVAHTAGAAGLVMLLTTLLVRAFSGRHGGRAPGLSPDAMRANS